MSKDALEMAVRATLQLLASYDCNKCQEAHDEMLREILGCFEERLWPPLSEDFKAQARKHKQPVSEE